LVIGLSIVYRFGDDGFAGMYIMKNRRNHQFIAFTYVIELMAQSLPNISDKDMLLIDRTFEYGKK
jgi:hypothetical protein